MMMYSRQKEKRDGLTTICCGLEQKMSLNRDKKFIFARFFKGFYR
jgi:hypothetical protein